jgi:Fe-S-cluster containining protein
VTAGDVQRIAAFINRRGFYEFRMSCDPEYDDQDDDPIWQRCVFRSDHTRRVLKRRTDGNCLFLAPSGCRLPLGFRPLVCRLHPYTYSARGLDPKLSADCPVHLLPPGCHLEDAIAGCDPVQADQWRRLLYAEILVQNRR